MKCPICDELFSSDDSFSKHIEFHKNSSVLSSTPEFFESEESKQVMKIKPQINLEKIFGKEHFENLISDKINQIEDVDELVKRRVFVEQIKKIIAKYPFVYMPIFIDDVMSGLTSTELLKKYHILNYMELKEIIENILKFNGYRYRVMQYDDAFDLNLKNSTWKEKYEIIKDNCIFFNKELLELLYYDTLGSYIVLITSDYLNSGISREEIISKSKSLENAYHIFNFMNESLKKSFEIFLENNYETTVKNIITDLIDEGILKKKRNNPNLLVGAFSIDEIKKSIIDELKFNSSSMTEKMLRSSINMIYHSLKLIPGFGLWETALSELENEKLIRIETKNNFRNDGLIFLNENYQKIQQKLQQFDNTPLEFYGRKISPENFVAELHELEKGDFGDSDDQVTRIAGLVLAESVKLYSPHEEILDFDFSINISNYDFRPEQLDAISKINFIINSEIFHCKVMIDEVLTLEKYNQLKKSLPENDQGVVITFKEIPDAVKKQIAEDASIQNIDEEGIKIWVSITSVIPSRKNSIAKLHFDPISKLEKKIVKINYINYENGLASVSILPHMQDATVLIRSLEEIPLYEVDPKEFNTFSANYLHFLRFLSNFAKESDFIEGLFNQKIVKTDGLSSALTIQFDHHEVLLKLKRYSKKEILTCTCLKWLENTLYLCPHLVSALDYKYRTDLFSCMDWNSDKNYLRKAFEIITADNISVILERLGVEIDDDEITGDKRIADFVSNMYKIKENF